MRRSLLTITHQCRPPKFLRSCWRKVNISWAGRVPLLNALHLGDEYDELVLRSPTSNCHLGMTAT